MRRGLKDILKGKLNAKEWDKLPSGFDVVGDILIFTDFPQDLEKKQKKIGTEILHAYKNIKVVCKKTGNYAGIFRTPKLRIIAGEHRKETEYRENGVRLKLNVEKVYFSARLAHERERINKQVREGEEVLVMFSGVGVYPINIAKNTKAKAIFGVEINPIAHKYAEENLRINKVRNITLILGDVNDVLPKINQAFDRVLMPLPKSAGNFLDIALSKVKRGGILHFYDFLHENEFGKTERKIRDACKRNLRECRVLKSVKCGQYGTRKYRVCVDAVII